MFKINTNFTPSAPDAFIVGGTVRDLLIGVRPKDYDIVTLDDPKKLAHQIAAKTGGKIVELGKPGLKIFRIVTPHKTPDPHDPAYDIAPANGATIEEDLAKRDFTINAMAISLDDTKNLVTIRDRVIDPFNGRKDLENRIIRATFTDNLKADPIRLLRAYRIGALLNFSIAPETAQAIKSCRHLIRQSAGERIRDELIKLFNTPDSRHYLSMMDETGLLTAMFPELAPLKECSQNIYHQYDAFEHTLKAYGFLEKFLHIPDSAAPEIISLKNFLPAAQNFALLKYAILIHDIGKPAARSIDAKGRIHFYSHEKISADMAVNINRRLRFSNQEQQFADFIIRHHLRPLSLFNAFKQDRLSRKSVSRFFLKCHPMAKEILIHSAADLYGKGINKNTQAFIEFLNYMIKQYTDLFLPLKSSPPLIDGNDLIREFGLKPSPLFSKILAHIEEERFAGNIANREDALAHVKKFLNLHNPS